MDFDVDIQLPEGLEPKTWDTVNAAMSGLGFAVKQASDARTVYQGSYEGNPDGLRAKIDEALQEKSLQLPMAISSV